jgi:hypothetical protein
VREFRATTLEESPMSPEQAPGQQPAAPTPTSGGGPRRLGAAAVAAIAAVSFVVAGVGGYLVGHRNGSDSGTTAGYSDGVAVGRAQATARYQPGQDGYQAIYTKGKAAGEAQGQQSGAAQGQSVGFEQGQKVGVQTGDSEGVRQGAAAVLGGFSTWTADGFYVVTMAAGTDPGVPYTISSRTQLQPGTSYQICSDASGGAAQQLCSSPVAPTG